MPTKRNLLILLLVCCALVGALFIASNAAHAQSGLPGEDCHSITTGDLLQQTMGTGFDGTIYAGGAFGYESRIKFELSLPAQLRISYVGFEWESTGNSYTEPVLDLSYTEDTGASYFGGVYIYGENVLNTWRAHSWTGPSANVSGSWWLYWFAAAPGGDDTLHLRNLTVCTVPPITTGSTPEYSSSPNNGATISLGSVTVDDTYSSTNALTVTNIGDAGSTLNVLSAELSGTNADQFAVDTIVPAVLAYGQALQVGVSCTPTSAGSKSATLTMRSDDSDESAVTYSLECLGDAGTGGSTWTKPLATIDQVAIGNLLLPTFTDFDPSNDGTTVISYSHSTGAPVHAVRGATIDSIQPVSGTCVNQPNLKRMVANSCMTADNLSFHVAVNDLPAFLSEFSPAGTGMYLPLQHLYWNDAYVVKSTDGDGNEYWYIVKNPRIKAGDVLAAGCVIGETLPMAYTDFTMGDVNLVAHSTSTGWTMVQARDSGDIWLTIKDKLTIEPDGSACAAGSSACALVYNPSFENRANGWILEQDETGQEPLIIPTGGVSLTGRLRSRAMNLSSTTSYIIEVRYRQVHFPLAFTVQLGTDAPISVTDTEERSGEITYTSTASTYTADASGTYSLVLTGTTNYPEVFIDFVCISEAGAQQPAPAGGCIVLDPELNQTLDTSPWDGSSSPDPPAFGAVGMMIVPDGGFIKQSITLHPNGGSSQEYKLWVEWRRQGVVQTDHNIAID